MKSNKVFVPYAGSIAVTSSTRGRHRTLSATGSDAAMVAKAAGIGRLGSGDKAMVRRSANLERVVMLGPLNGGNGIAGLLARYALYRRVFGPAGIRGSVAAPGDHERERRAGRDRRGRACQACPLPLYQPPSTKLAPRSPALIV